jgi:hypothetical protein
MVPFLSSQHQQQQHLMQARKQVTKVVINVMIRLSISVGSNQAQLSERKD